MIHSLRNFTRTSIFIFSLLASVTAVSQPLSGTYSIDGSGGGDYVSFTTAINALNSQGVSGATTFEVVDGTYNEQIDIAYITGSSSTNSITFRSQLGNAAGVILSFSSTSIANNYVLNFNSTSYVTIQDITIKATGSNYGRVITSSSLGSNSNITIDQCIIEGLSVTSNTNSAYYVVYITGSDNDNWIFSNNTVKDGNFGLYFAGAGANNLGLNNEFNGNSFIDQYFRSVFVNDQDNLIFTGNYVTSNSVYSAAIAITLSSVTNGEFSNNYVKGTADWPRYGLFLSSVKGSLTQFLQVRNNRIFMTSSNARYGMYIIQGLNLDVSNNSIFMDSQSFSSRAMYFSSGSYNAVFNNIIQHVGFGTGIYLTGNPIYLMDYNNISVPNGTTGFKGSSYNSLSDWQTGTTFDSNSYDFGSVFTDSVTLKVCTDSLYGKGVFSNSVVAPNLVDFEGDSRQNPPCIGADEFMPFSQFGFDDQTLCNGDTLALTQGYYDTVVWNMVDTTNVIYVNSVGTQTVTVMGTCGTGTVTFNVVAQQMASITDTNLCEGTTAALETGISNATYLWNDGSTGSTFSVDSAQTVWVSVLDMYGCSSVDTAIVTQSTDVNLPDSAIFCTGENVILDANILASSYLWSSGSVNQVLTVTSSGLYSVTVTDQNCVSTDSTYVLEIFDAIASFTDSSNFFTVQFTNTSQNADSSFWDFGDGTTSNDEHPLHIFPYSTQDVEHYTVTLTAYNECGNNDAINDSVRVGQLVSVSEIELASIISVYPNPNNGVFRVVLKSVNSAAVKIEVVDARGASVSTQNLGVIQGDFSQEINLKNAASGIYFVRVILNNESAVYRIVLQ